MIRIDRIKLSRIFVGLTPFEHRPHLLNGYGNVTKAVGNVVKRAKYERSDRIAAKSVIDGGRP
jgi:hypothetical protein